MERINIRIGDVLKELGYITDEQLNQALDYQKQHRDKRIGTILTEQGFITERKMLLALAQRLNYMFVDMSGLTVDPEAVRLLPREFAERNSILAVNRENGRLTVAVNDPMNFVELDYARQQSGMDLNIWLAEKEPLDRAIARYYSELDAKLNAISASNELANMHSTSFADAEDEDAPIINLLNNIMMRAYLVNASDVHIEPYENQTLIRMRVDGVITDYDTIPKNIHSVLITRIKIISDLDIGEKRLPQDGHFKTNIEGHTVNVRVSLVPTVFGETAVLRLLASNTTIANSEHYGMQQDEYEKLARMLRSPNGIIYISGPTGSGKTTTLYMILQELVKNPVSIATIEDPVERNIPNVNHIQVNHQAGLTFERGLRAILRQDPDIIMVGETRDAETAEISIRSAISGHMVLSTIHTNDAPSTIARLADMGIERYMIASSLVGIVAQRLLRRLCPECAKDDVPTDEERDFLGAIDRVKRPCGCKYCNNTGYKGRIAIHEILIVDRQVRDMITNRSSVEEISDYAQKAQNMKRLADCGAELVRKGETSVEELMRATYSV